MHMRRVRYLPISYSQLSCHPEYSTRIQCDQIRGPVPTQSPICHQQCQQTGILHSHCKHCKHRQIHIYSIVYHGWNAFHSVNLVSTHLNVIFFTVCPLNGLLLSVRDINFWCSKSYRSTVPSLRPAANKNSNGWNLMLVTGDACSWNSIIFFCVRMSQMITEPSVPADAIHDPSGENFTELTLAIWPRYFSMHESLLRTSHSRTVVSLLPDATYSPYGWKSNVRTLFMWP